MFFACTDLSFACLQPLGKGLLQRLLLNLCAHSVTRLTLLQLLLDMLRPEAEGISTGGISADGAQSQRLYGCQWNVVYSRSQMSDGNFFYYHVPRITFFPCSLQPDNIRCDEDGSGQGCIVSKSLNMFRHDLEVISYTISIDFMQESLLWYQGGCWRY